MTLQMTLRQYSPVGWVEVIAKEDLIYDLKTLLTCWLT